MHNADEESSDDSQSDGLPEVLPPPVPVVPADSQTRAGTSSEGVEELPLVEPIVFAQPVAGSSAALSEPRVPSSQDQVNAML